MPKESKSMYVVLGILSIRPMSGYDIKTWIKTSVGYFWKISYNQIYPALGKFVEKGLATYVTDKKNKRPERKVYSLTEEGLEVLRNWLVEPIDYSNPNGSELLLKLFFGSQIPLEETIKHIESYRECTSRILCELRGIENLMQKDDKSDPTLPFRFAALNNGIISNESMIKWCDWAISRFKAGKNEMIRFTGD